MKSFLLKDNTPILKWGLLPDGVFFEGNIPEGYSLAICPTNEKQIILDVDNKNGKCGFDHIPKLILEELNNTFWYYTKSGGAHYFLNYTGDKLLKNCSTKYGLDLRIGANKKTGNNGGYVKYNHNVDIRECIPLIKETSVDMNKWLEELFS
jgi:hypothetical protein